MEADGRTATTLAYDKGGNRLREDGDDGGHDYRYGTGSNRLIAVTGDGAAAGAARLQSAWLYHPTGVPLARLSPVSTAAARGHVADDGGRRIVYNGARRPIAVYGAQRQLIARYFYGGNGERIAKTVYAAGTGSVAPAGQVAARTTYSLYRDQRLAAETDAEGRITTHYLYLYGKPVAKVDMTPDTSVGHRWWVEIKTLGGLLAGDGAGDSDAAVYAIHTDHLGTPQAVTDEHGQLAWQAETTPFGQANVRFAAATAAGGKFELKLRLPGQVHDAETGLSQNYYRDYDPQLGRYLTADPLGLDGGMNPYGYVNANPLSGTDPLGLYQIDFHYYMVFYLGLASGLDPEVARTIALASQYVDDGNLTKPVELNKEGKVDIIESITDNQDALRYYHFMQDTLAEGLNIHEIKKGNQMYNLYQAYVNGKDECGKADFFGGLLHSLGDTYSHADPDDDPYTGVKLFLGTGHGWNGSDPDYTFSHWGFPAIFNKVEDKLDLTVEPNNGIVGATYWPTNSDRTL
jgi:RHS repeat-associated protein